MVRICAAVVLWLALVSPALAGRLDERPRIAVVSAFAPEMGALKAGLTGAVTHEVAGVQFTTGMLEGKPVVLFLSGISMVNAAMTTQIALDHFKVTAIVFSGIAGGIDGAYRIGDVIVPAQWGQYLESEFVREQADGSFRPRPGANAAFANHGMIFPGPVRTTRAGGPQEQRFWFPADAAMLAVAGRVAGEVALTRCTPDGRCLGHAPRVVVGGNGVSGSVFMDNAAFRDYLARTFEARAVDMESAAVAHVAYANAMPFIAFRSLSDLAGGGEGENEVAEFFRLASENSAAVVRAFLRALPAPADAPA